MKFMVCYIDDQAGVASIQASGPELAARQFLAGHPRADTSQIVVESRPTAPDSGSNISHFRACDLHQTPAPPEEVGEEDLAFRTMETSYPDFERTLVVTGSADTLRLLATRLVEAVSTHDHYTVPLTPADGSRKPLYLCFARDPDPSGQWTHGVDSPRFWRRGFGLCSRALIFILSCLGLWTLSRWMLSSL